MKKLSIKAETKWFKKLLPKLKNKQIENYFKYIKAHTTLKETEKDFDIVHNEFEKLDLEEIKEKSQKHISEIKDLNEELENKLKELE